MGAAVLEYPPVVSGRFVQGMAEEEYHAHPALSQTGMKALLRSPRHFKALRAMNRARPEFDVGHAAHAMILGVGSPVVEIPSRLLSVDGGIRTTAAKEFVAQAQAEGKTPLKPAVYMAVKLMVDSVLKHEKARGLLERPGFTEVSLFAQDPGTGVNLRGRLDRLALDGEGVWLPIDVKSTTDVQLRKVTNAIVDFGYDLQAAAYRELLRLVLGIEPEPMHFVFVEKQIPHEVRVIRLADPAWIVGGERKMRDAIDLFAWCNERGQWPGADEDDGPIQDLPAPGWYSSRFFDDGAEPEGTAF